MACCCQCPCPCGEPLPTHSMQGDQTSQILKEINPEYSLERPMLKLQYFDHPMRRANSLEMTLILGKIEGIRRRGCLAPVTSHSSSSGNPVSGSCDSHPSAYALRNFLRVSRPPAQAPLTDRVLRSPPPLTASDSSAGCGGSHLQDATTSLDVPSLSSPALATPNYI